MTRIGIALGSGGARGLAHIGVLAVLEREGLAPACVAGTSMGAIVGALWAETLDADETARRIGEYTNDPPFRASWEPFLPDEEAARTRGFFSEILRHVQRKLVTFRTLTSPAQQSADRLLEPLRRLFRVERIEDLRIPFAAVSADLVSGRLRVFRSGNLVRAIYASSAIPGVFPPLVDGDALLIDGGGPARVPVRACRKLGPDFVIAVDIPTFLAEDAEYRTGLDTILRSDAITRNELGELVLKGADLVVRPDVEHFHWARFSAGAQIRAAGEAAMVEALPELRRRLRAYENPRARVRRKIERWWGRRRTD